MGGDEPPPPSTAAPEADQRRSITYDRYMELVHQLVLKVNAVERDTSRGLSRAELIQWYLESHEHEIDTVQQLHEEQDLIGRVISKMIRDGYLVLLPVDEADRDAPDERRVLMVHPQVDVDSLQ